MMVYSVLLRVHALRQALAHNDDGLTVLVIGLIEIASSDNRHAERREKSGRHRSKHRPRVLFAGSAYVSIGRKLEPRTPNPLVPSWHSGPHGDAINAGESRDLPDHFFIEPVDLVRRAPLDNQRHVQRQHIM